MVGLHMFSSYGWCVQWLVSVIDLVKLSTKYMYMLNLFLIFNILQAPKNVIMHSDNLEILSLISY